jgi:hypothetical protein
MKKITITMILTLVLALTTTLALAGNTNSSDLAGRLEEKITSCQLDVQKMIASAPQPVAGNSDAAALKGTSDFVARLGEKVSSCEKEVQEILRSAPRPRTAIPGELFHVDPQVDEFQMKY